MIEIRNLMNVCTVVAQWIKPQTLNHEVLGSIFPHCLVSWKGLKVIGHLVVVCL